MCEDKVFQRKILESGYKIFFQRKAIDYHAHIYTVESLAKRCENEGMGWRMAGQNYSLIDMIRDLFNPEMIILLLRGIWSQKIRSASEMLFPVIRPIFIFKGNHFTKKYVK
jgi:rhamnosyltransferase